MLADNDHNIRDTIIGLRNITYNRNDDTSIVVFYLMQAIIDGDNETIMVLINSSKMGKK